MFLNLCAAQITLLGLKLICEGLKTNVSLLSLDISNNYLGPNVSKYLAGTLSASCLEELNLANNKLSDQGILNLAPLFGKLNVNRIKVQTNHPETRPDGQRDLVDRPDEASREPDR